MLRSTPDALYLVGGAGGPLGGDELTLDVEVGGGARLAVRTAGASIALPGTGLEPSSVRMRVRVAPGGELRWLPEPVVAARGSRHRTEASIVLEHGARLVWREELVLGRHREPPGSVRTKVLVDLGGAPLLRHELALGPDHSDGGTPAVVGAARYVGSMLVVEPAWHAAPGPVLLGPRAAVLPLTGPAVQVVALADDAVGLRRALDKGMSAVDAVSV